MATETITIDGATYTLAPINFSQYEDAIFDSNGDPLRNIKTGSIVAASLANAENASNPEFEKVPAGHVLKLLPVAIKISGLAKEPEGEATAAESLI
jgi:hypothetical protein